MDRVSEELKNRILIKRHKTDLDINSNTDKKKRSTKQIKLRRVIPFFHEFGLFPLLFTCRLFPDDFSMEVIYRPAGTSQLNPLAIIRYSVTFYLR